MIPIKHFYMIRHGETEANAARIMAGMLDSPLTERGREQARNVQRVVETLHIKPSRIIHSHLSRARDTASIINQALNIPMVEDPDYAEMHAGDWEGAPYEDCNLLFKGWTDPPGGEPYQAFFDRVKRAKIKALQTETPVMVVCHGGVFRAFWKLYDIHSEGVQNCKLYEFEPVSTPLQSAFPWKIWRYDIEEEIMRRPVTLDTHPASEIAS